MAVYILQHLNLTTGKRTDMPWRFEQREEAMAKVLELSMAAPDEVYVVKVLPAA
ncbi:MAG TPA: hypothetical protein VF768_12045 [Holophagaceae bacterium]